MSAKNFRINRQQAWTISNLASYAQDSELVINGESYDPEAESFDFAYKLKEEAPEAVWRAAESIGLQEGWLFLTMNAEGKWEPMDGEYEDEEEEL